MGDVSHQTPSPHGTYAAEQRKPPSADWQKFRIPLDNRDLARIKTGFGWSLAGQGKPVTFYLDDIRYVGPMSPRQQF